MRELEPKSSASASFATSAGLIAIITGRRSHHRFADPTGVHDIEVETNVWYRAATARERTSVVASKLFSDEQRHGLALLVDYVPKSMPYILVLP